MSLTAANYYRYSTTALETALLVLNGDHELYGLIEQELERRAADNELPIGDR